MTSAAYERRVAPRFAVKCIGELAYGTSVADVAISDISVTGCGVELDDAPEDTVEEFGVLCIQSDDGQYPPVLLPVSVCNNRVESGKVRLGLKFRRLNMTQMRSLIAVMDGIIRK